VIAVVKQQNPTGRQGSEVLENQENGEPPIPLNYHKPDRRHLWGIHWGTPVLLIGVLICGLLGSALQHYFHKTEPNLIQWQLDSTGGKVYVVPSTSPTNKP